MPRPADNEGLARDRRAQFAGFTITELIVASGIVAIGVLMAVGGFGYLVSEIHLEESRNALDIDVQKAIERIKYDLRLSALDKMFFYPEGPGPYTAISFPMARDDDGDGAVDKDSNDRIVWDRTVIYHVRTASPNQLRRTVFDPRDNSLTDAQRQGQLNAVAVNGTAAGTYNASNATTAVVFENLFSWSITPRGAVFDGYASATGRAVNVELGSIALDNGTHQFKFDVTGKQTNSTGYAIGIDAFHASPSYSVREGEMQLPVVNQTGAYAARRAMQTGSWSGNSDLYFPAQRVGDGFTLNVENDRWEETNFQSLGDSHSNTVVKYDASFDPADFTVALQGNATNWSAWLQCADPAGTSSCPVAAFGAIVRVLLRGEDMEIGNWIQHAGARSKVCFSAGGTQAVLVVGAYLGVAASANVTTTDMAAGTIKKIRFGGNDWALLPAGGSVWSDWVDQPIDPGNSYIVSYQLGNLGGTRLRYWTDAAHPTIGTSFAIVKDTWQGDLLRQPWSGNTNVVAYAGVIGVEHLFTSYPTQGRYVSIAFDTHVDSPVYREINVDAAIASGSRVDVRVRTGTAEDMSDAPAWTDVAPIPPYGVIDPGTGRYVQFLIDLFADSTATLTPKIKGLTVRWNGPPRVVDVGGTFTRGPDYGTFVVTVDGKEIRTGVSVNLDIFKSVRAHRGMQVVRSYATAEIKPCNTGL